MVWLMFYTENRERERERDAESPLFLSCNQSMHIINHAFYYAFVPSVFLNSHVTALLSRLQQQQQRFWVGLVVSMAVSNGVEAVLEFLRKNGLSEAESALREDIIENTDLGTFDYEKFFFPMVPPPPPVRVRSFSRPSGLSAAGNCSISSSDEFVSIGSPTSRVSSSGTSNLEASYY